MQPLVVVIFVSRLICFSLWFHRFHAFIPPCIPQSVHHYAMVPQSLRCNRCVPMKKWTMRAIAEAPNTWKAPLSGADLWSGICILEVQFRYSKLGSGLTFETRPKNQVALTSARSPCIPVRRSNSCFSSTKLSNDPKVSRTKTSQNFLHCRDHFHRNTYGHCHHFPAYTHDQPGTS